MRYVFLAVLLIAAVGCRHTQAPGDPDVRLTTDQSQYAAGDELEVQLHNQTDQILGYNLCVSELERQEGDVWAMVPDTAMVCTMIQHGLEPGDSASFLHTLTGDLPEGTYRFSTSVEFRADARNEKVATEAFTVGT